MGVIMVITGTVISMDMITVMDTVAVMATDTAVTVTDMDTTMGDITGIDMDRL